MHIRSFSRVVAYPSSFIHPLAARLVGVAVLPPRERCRGTKKTPPVWVGVGMVWYVLCCLLRAVEEHDASDAGDGCEHVAAVCCFVGDAEVDN